MEHKQPMSYIDFIKKFIELYKDSDKIRGNRLAINKELDIYSYRHIFKDGHKNVDETSEDMGGIILPTEAQVIHEARINCPRELEGDTISDKGLKMVLHAHYKIRNIYGFYVDKAKKVYKKNVSLYENEAKQTELNRVKQIANETHNYSNKLGFVL